MRLILFDDHRLFGVTLKETLNKYDFIGDVYYTCVEAELWEFLSKNEDGILLLDINLRGAGISDSFSLAEKILSADENRKIIFLSGYDLPMYRKKARDIGAKAFISKGSPLDILISTIMHVEKGGTFFKQTDKKESETLTNMETEVLKLAAMGNSRREVGEKLYISTRTVGTHFTNIFMKLGAKNTSEAVAIALEEGYIPPIY